MENLTWQQFIRSKREVENLQDFFDEIEEPTAGFIYMDHWYIEKSDNDFFYLMIYNEDWITNVLVSLETKLFNFLKEENAGMPE